MKDDSFWRWYTRLVAVAAAIGFSCLLWRAATPTTPWWTNPASLALASTLLGAIVPLTAFISSWAKIQLDDRRQGHEIAQAQAKQAHDITTDYLNRALDPSFPIALRYQLLRFLSTPSKDGRQLETWAEGELKRLDPILQRLSADVEQAHSEVLNAKDQRGLVTAEQKLQSALSRLGSAVEAPKVPPVSAAALKARLHVYKDLGPLDFPGEDLSEAVFQGCKLSGSNFKGTNLDRARFYGADARGCCFEDATLVGASLHATDMRGANLRHADLTRADFNQTRLEGADLFGALLPTNGVRVCYDTRTIWPDGFNPVAADCILVDDD